MGEDASNGSFASTTGANENRRDQFCLATRHFEER
jgi:hypothetical protein